MAGESIADMPDTVTPPSDADLAPAEPMAAGAVEAEPTPRERREKLRTIFLGGLLALAALIIVLSLVALFVIVAVLLSGPISNWIGRLPETLPRIEQRLGFLSKPIKSMQGAIDHLESLAAGGAAAGKQAVPQAAGQ